MGQKKYIAMVAGIAKAGMEAYTTRILKDIAEHSSAQEGCQLYQVSQALENESEFLMYSVWDSEAAFSSHNQSAKMQEFKKELAKSLFEERSKMTAWQLLD